jgi:hypothetical protein
MFKARCSIYHNMVHGRLFKYEYRQDLSEMFPAGLGELIIPVSISSMQKPSHFCITKSSWPVALQVAEIELL